MTSGTRELWGGATQTKTIRTRLEAVRQNSLGASRFHA